MAYSYSDITFLENPFSFSVTLKTSLEPLRTIFPWCPLGLHLCSGQCPFNQEKCLRRCGTEDRNGSLRSPKLPLSPRWIKLANCSCWHYWSLSIGGGMIKLYSLLFLWERGGLGEPKANRSFLFYSSIIKPVITPILDLLFLEKSNTSIRINISIKILFHYR